MRFKGIEREEPSLNLAPLIDVVFLLLIFFMVTTSFVRDDAIDLALPEASSQQTPLEDFSIRISVSKFDDIRVEDSQSRFSSIAGGTQRRTLKQGIGHALEQLQRERGGSAGISPTVIIEADRAASHGRVIELMDVVSQLGLSKIQFAVIPTPGDD